MTRKNDRHGRPLSTLNADERKVAVELLLSIWNDHPKWGLGQLVAKAARIRHGVPVSVERAPDSDIIAGLEALVPAEWEIESGAREIVTVELSDDDSIELVDFQIDDIRVEDREAFEAALGSGRI